MLPSMNAPINQESRSCETALDFNVHPVESNMLIPVCDNDSGIVCIFSFVYLYT